MNDLVKIVLSAAVGFALGRLTEWLSERKRDLVRVREDYLKLTDKPEIAGDEYLRFAALQRAGGWKLTQHQLEAFAEDIRGRGLPDPYSAWKPGFPEMENFPTDFLEWAKDNQLDLSKPEEALLKMAEELDADLEKLPKPPEGPFIGSFLI